MIQFLKNLFAEKEQVKHNWKLAYSQLSKDHTTKDDVFRCEDCGIYEHRKKPVYKNMEVIGNIHEKK